MDGIQSTQAKLLITTAVAAILFTAGVSNSHANNELQATADLLKTCLDKNIAEQTAKQKPSKEAVIGRCKKEFDALEDKLPASAKVALKQNIQTGVGKKLKTKK